MYGKKLIFKQFLYPYYDPFGVLSLWTTKRITPITGNKIIDRSYVTDTSKTINKTGFFVGSILWHDLCNINHMYSTTHGKSVSGIFWFYTS